MKRNGNRFEVHVADGIGSMRSDPQRITQCLLNLLSNAAKFTEHGLVKLDVHVAASDLVEFAVADTGIGVSKEGKERLFQRFEQIESGGTRQEGTGLGLSLSRHLAERMGGEIAVDSEEGSGSTFTLKLPRNSAPPRFPPVTSSLTR